MATSGDCVGATPEHRGSVATSEMMTRSLRNAAVPQEPMSGPIIAGESASLQPRATRARAAGQRRLPSGSARRTVEVMSGLGASIAAQRAVRVSPRLAPAAIISSVRLAARRRDSEATGRTPSGSALDSDRPGCVDALMALPPLSEIVRTLPRYTYPGLALESMRRRRGPGGTWPTNRWICRGGELLSVATQ